MPRKPTSGKEVAKILNSQDKPLTGPVTRLAKGATPNAREKQLVNYAMDLAEKQLREGTASSAVITHFLKLGSIQQQQELELLKSQTILAKAKADAIVRDKNTEELTEKAIEAFKSYGPTNADDHE
jgi:hypothetical protein